MSGAVIPDAAVEAAAKVMQAKDAHEGFGDYPLWEYKEDAAAILEAAAKHMLAPVAELADELVLSALAGSAYQTGRGSGFRIAGTRIRQVLGLAK